MLKFDASEIRPDMRRLMRETMFRAIHHNAMGGLRRKTYAEFLRSLKPGAEPFSVDRVWQSLQESTRHHWTDHSLPAVNAIDQALGYSADQAEPVEKEKGQDFYRTISDDQADIDE